MKSIAIVFASLALTACSSSPSSSSTSMMQPDSGGACGVPTSGKLTFTSVTSSSTNGPSCPNLTADQLNAGQNSADDSGSSMCTTTPGDPGSCTIAVSCGGSAGAILTISGHTLSGGISIAIDDAGTYCSYDLQGMF